MNDKLHHDLTRIADELPIIDIYDGVLTESRKLRTRRAALAGGLGVVLLAGLTGAGLAVLPDDPVNSGVAADERSWDTGVDGEGKIPGSLFYISGNTVYERTDSEQAQFTVEGPGPENGTLGVSPDSGYLSYVDSEKLVIEDSATNEPITLADPMTADSVDTGCSEPVWSPVSNEIAYVVLIDGNMEQQELHISNVDTGELVDSFPISGCRYRWSADGEKLVYQTGRDREMVVVNRDGTDPRNFSIDVDADTVVDLEEVSAGAEKVCVTLDNDYVDSDGRFLSCDTVFDTVTGKTEPVPVVSEVEDTLGIRFTPDGGMLVRAVAGETTARLYLLGPDNEVLAEGDEPAELYELELLDYTAAD